jgi:hypothetical protein
MPSLGRAVSVERYLQLLHQARTDDALPLGVRVALLFILLGLQNGYDILRMKAEHIHDVGGSCAEVSFTKGIAQLFEGVDAEPMLRLARERDAWLFPSSYTKGAHRSDLGDILRSAGIQDGIRRLRNAGVRFHIYETDAWFVGRVLGWNFGTAAVWSRRTSGANRRLAEYLAGKAPVK